MKEVEIISKVVGRTGTGAVGVPSVGGIPSVDLSGYLLKKVWDEAFELKETTDGTPYLYGKLPVVVQYGITMYGEGGNVDIPSIYAGLPIDGTTIYWDGGVLKAQGGGSGGGITDITSSMVVNALGYTPANASDLTTLQSTVNDFLSGSDTDTIINKWKELEVFLSGLSESDNLATILGTKADKATTLAGYGIADAYTKSDVNTLLGDYVTLATAQTITGKKDFTTGGLFVNGKQIQYIPIDGDSGYWKLEGDLLVTGGITMFANEGTYTPSTIMDGLVLDSATLGINDEGQLYVKGGTGGGSIEGLATVATTGKYSDLIGVPTLLSSFTDDVVAGKYLPLSGGTLKSTNVPLTINRIASEGAYATIGYTFNDTQVGYLGFASDGNLVVSPRGTQNNTNYYGVWHEGNLNPSRYLPLSGGTMEGDIILPVGKYIRNQSTTYAILGVGADNIVICGEPKNPLHLRGTQVNIPQKTFIEGDGANVLTLKRNNTAGGAFCFYKAMNQDALGWIAGSDSAHEFIFNYTSDGLSTNTNLLRLTTEGHLFNKGNVTIGSVEKTNNVVALNVLGKGWFSNGVKLKNDTASYNANGITFSSTVGGSILGRIGGDTNGNIGIFPTGTFAVRPGYTGTGAAYGLTVDGRGSVGIDFTTNRVGLWLRQKSNELAWMAYAPSNQTTNVWVIGAETDNVFRMRYSSNGLSTTPTTKFALNTNGLLSTAMGLQVNGASVISTTTPSIALPFSSYVSFGGYHALRGETNAVVLCAPVSASGMVILRPNGNASAKYQFSINNLGEAVLSSESAASLTINRTATTGGAYVRYNAAGQTTYGWISGSSPNHTYQCQYFNGSGYYIKSELDSNGNFLAYGGITMYSDIRKKTKLADVELSLSQIANAPLIEHYYNSDDKRTTHVGSIAQYWAEMNDWFCKKDQEGFYTMEIQNAALASAISVARHLQKYETKTDRKIRMMKKRIQELENKVEQLEKLKSA